MKLVTAIIQPHRLEEVKKAVMAEGVKGMTVSQVNGYGRQRGHTEVYRGEEFWIDFIAKIRIDILARDADAGLIVDTICGAARSGSIGDGKVWVQPVDEVVRVRTGERGDAAV